MKKKWNLWCMCVHACAHACALLFIPFGQTYNGVTPFIWAAGSHFPLRWAFYRNQSKILLTALAITRNFNELESKVKYPPISGKKELLIINPLITSQIHLFLVLIPFPLYCPFFFSILSSGTPSPTERQNQIISFWVNLVHCVKTLENVAVLSDFHFSVWI